MGLFSMKSFHSFLLEENTFTDKSVKENQVFKEDQIYTYIQKLHRNQDDFTDGDISTRIEKYKQYKVETVNIEDIDIKEFDLVDEYVEDYVEELKKKKTYPPIVLAHNYQIIDGTHRANALAELGYKKIVAFVGIKK